jgi:hypothetical protein
MLPKALALPKVLTFPKALTLPKALPKTLTRPEALTAVYFKLSPGLVVFLVEICRHVRLYTL